MMDLFFAMMCLCKDKRKEDHIIPRLEQKWTMLRKKKIRCEIYREIGHMRKKCINVAGPSK